MAEPTSLRPTCPCGHDRDHPHVIGEAQYRRVHFGLGLLMGMSMGNPKSVVFRCVVCRTIVEETTDPAVCLDYRN